MSANFAAEHDPDFEVTHVRLAVPLESSPSEAHGTLAYLLSVSSCSLIFTLKPRVE